MSSLFDAIVYGPFNAEYHRLIVGDTFRAVLSDFLERKLLPQVDHEVTGTSGKLTACFDEDQYCSPNSLVRDCFRLELAIRGPVGQSSIKTELAYNSEEMTFAARRGHSLYLWTPSRQRRRQSEQKAIQQTVQAVLDGGVNQPTCPLCSTPLRYVNTSDIFDALCPNRCFKYNFHKDGKGRPLHGHFIMGNPKENE